MYTGGGADKHYGNGGNDSIEVDDGDGELNRDLADGGAHGAAGDTCEVDPDDRRRDCEIT
jgi:hypothetical protein